jgi:hypothetical protein
VIFVEWYYPIMNAHLTHKMAAVPKNDNFVLKSHFSCKVLSVVDRKKILPTVLMLGDCRCMRSVVFSFSECVLNTTF